MRARLADPWFEAEFYGHVSATGLRRQGGNIDGAQGLFLWCPCGYQVLDADGKEKYPLDLSLKKGRPHGVMIPFANPRNALACPADHGPVDRAGGHPRWTMTGTGLDDLTLTPSVAVGGAPECWHGFITNGEVTG
jgi:hypothetical protein